MKTADPARRIAQVPFSARPGTFDDRFAPGYQSADGHYTATKSFVSPTNIATTVVNLRRLCKPENTYIV
jgi:hypothetical protein